jgi:hypothetical protein
MCNYGSVAAGDTFFGARLHAYDWDRSTPADKLKALVQASELIDQFDYIGQKATVYTLVQASDEDTDWTTDTNRALIQAAEEAQPLEFPRDADSTVPTEIENATYLIAKALLSGRDPEADLENLAVRQSQYGGVKTTYQREGNNQEHLAHLIPSPQAFNLIRPFFRERDLFDVKRVS